MTAKLYIFCGIPFSGKSTLTKEIAKRKGFTRIDLDEVKFDLYGKDITDQNLQQKDWDSIYQEMYKRIEKALQEGKTVIHDTGNFTKSERNLVRQIADRLDVPTTTVFVDTSKEVAKERLIANRTTNRRFNVTDTEFEEAVAEMEVPDESEHAIVYKSGTPVDSWIAEKMTSEIDDEIVFIKHLLQLNEDAKITYVDTGWTSRVFVVDDGKYVVKFPRNEATKKEYIQEIAILTLLEGIDAPVLVPRITHKDKNNDYVAYAGIIGTALDFLPNKMDIDTQRDVGRSLGTFLKQLHSLHLEGAQMMSLEDEIAQFQQKYEEGKVALEDTLTDEQKDQLHELVYTTLPAKLRELGYDKALCHGDLGYWNLILSNEDKIGVIDYGDVGYWDRSKDFIGMEDELVLESALAAYGDNPLLREKIAARQKVLSFLDLSYFVETKDIQGTQKIIERIKAMLKSAETSS